jgi:hypothetical protein
MHQNRAACVNHGNSSQNATLLSHGMVFVLNAFYQRPEKQAILECIFAPFPPVSLAYS